MPSVGLGGGFSANLTQLSIGLGASYFVANGLALGLSVTDTVFIFSQDFRAAYPGIEDQVATNMLRIMPSLRYVFWRNRRFSPYVHGGAGPVFLNHGGGMVGEWNAGPGAYIGLGGPVFLDLGVGFSARFPKETCDAGFYYNGPDAAGQVIDACSFRWGPRIGLVLAFGGSRASAPRRSREERQPPQQTWEEPAIEVAPAPAPAPEAAPVEPAAAPAPEVAPTPAPETAAPVPETVPASEGVPAPEAQPDGATEPVSETPLVVPPAS